MLQTPEIAWNVSGRLRLAVAAEWRAKALPGRPSRLVTENLNHVLGRLLVARVMNFSCASDPVRDLISLALRGSLVGNDAI